jgi:hypothetical protein
VCALYTPNHESSASTQPNRAERRRELRLQRKTQRRLERLIAADESLGVGSIDDSAFFEQHPERRFRLRLATPNESAVVALIGDVTNDSHDERFDWMLIKQIAPGVRARMGLFATMPPGYCGGEISEEIARATFEHYARGVADDDSNNGR